MGATDGGRGKKRYGCVVLASFFFALWLSIAWLLWQWSMSLPAQDTSRQDTSREEGEKPTFFELMPRAEGS